MPITITREIFYGLIGMHAKLSLLDPVINL